MRVGVTAIVLGALSACGAGGPDSSDRPSAGSSKSPTQQRPQRAAFPKLKVGDAFDNTAGWSAELVWPPAGAASYPVAAAPETGVIGYLESWADGYVLRVRDARKGQDRFYGAPWEAPKPMTKEDELGTGDSGVPESSSARSVSIPEVQVIRHQGREYFVVWAQGLTRGGPLSKSKRSFSAAAYPADSTGKDVAPLRSAEIPLGDRARDLTVRVSGPGLVVRWKLDKVVALQDKAATFDAVSGKVRNYDAETQDVVGLSARGPVIASKRGDLYKVPGAWTSARSTPRNARQGSAYPIGAVGGYAVATWRSARTLGDQAGLWSIQDVGTGRLVANVQCRLPRLGTFQNGVGPSHLPRQSPNGRYVISGPVIFDTKEKKGYCFGETEARKGVLLTGIGDGGEARGVVDEAGDTRRITAEPGSRDARVVKSDRVLPLLDGAGVGVFKSRSGRSPAIGFVVYPVKD